MSTQELEQRIVEAAVAKHQALLRTEVRSDGKEYLVSSDVQEWERCGDALNQAVRDLIAFRNGDVDIDLMEWPDVIDA